jgi:hypothetical protein
LPQYFRAHALTSCKATVNTWRKLGIG